MQQNKLPQVGRFLSSSDVCERYGISRFTLRRWVADPAMDFPKPTVINRLNYYREVEIFRWEMKKAGYDPDMPPTLSALEPVSGVVTDYEQLVDALTKRRHDIKMSSMELDAVSGMQEGYTSKLENYGRPQGRGLGPEIFPLWLGGLRVGVVLVDLPRRPRRFRNQAAAARDLDLEALQKPS